MDKFICIKEAAELIGVTTTTLRRWEENKSFIPHHRTICGHRRYELKCVLNLLKKGEQTKEKKIVCYSRVSAHSQKDDLSRQTKLLEEYVENICYKNTLTINDIGSGLNFKKKGLNKLIKLILNNEVDKIIITHKDRLLCFGSDLLINIAKHIGVKIIILNDKQKTYEEDLVCSVLEIITVFSAKLYGSRRNKKK